MKVSVLMSVYNGECYLQESISSILNQTFSDFEFIIIDDCSTDSTWSILQHNSKQDPRIFLVNNSENLGLIKSLNKGLKLAKGSYIARQDADDISLPQRLEREVEILDKYCDCILVSGEIEFVNEGNERVINTSKRSCSADLVTWYLLFYNHVAGHSQVMYRRDAVISIGSYSSEWLYTEDYELWCRLARANNRLVILPETFLRYRCHSQSISQKKVQEQEAYCLKLIQSNINQLTGKSITAEEAKILTGFWKGTLNSRDAHHQFPPANQVGFVYNLLNEIKEQFIQKYEPVFGSNLPSQIDAVICQQFLAWLASPLTANHSIWSKVLISRYAFLWSPLGVLTAWLAWFLRFPIDTFYSIRNKLKNRFIFQITTSES